MQEEQLIRLTEFVIAKIQKGWCKDACALDKKDESVAYNSRKAVKWSVHGAFHLGLERLKIPERNWNDLLAKFNELLGGSIVRLNDDAPSLEAVLKSCRNLIARLRRQPLDE